MAIFQKSVIQKHLNNLDKNQVETAFQKFRENYSPAKIEKIKQLKEEEYQDGFLRDLFVDVLGYTLKPDANYNLVREFKNQADGRKADGAIIDNKGVEPVALAVIELKSTKTKDFKNVTEQAFGYKNNQPECKYVIISNFQKLRFYIDYANEYEEFDLFHLNKEDFELLYLILNKESVFSNLPLKLKEETKFHEQEVSGKLYKDYSVFRSNLFDNLLRNNLVKGTCPLVLDKLTLFNKSQKLLDRFLFVLFAEDSGLLPPNSISRIVKRFEVLKEEDAYKPIYEIFKQYFGYMNVGRKGKSSSDDIPAYNGGLFHPDELLDKLKIDDKILIDDLLKLSEYDFSTEVDVNILGHIFEHSLSEIEEITAGIEGTATDKTKSKRKKDGVFYTPKYITQYIVENTIGTLCNEKRAALEIEEIEFDGTYKKKDGTLSAKGKSLFQKLKDYKDWLLLLKIVDPACGSGAFLNQALNFLIQEHKNIDDIIAELTNTALRLFDTDKAILENNLYGVDINEESVEIAKLSLWLRTAQKGCKLSVLSNNIKCGNSLIDDPEVAGEKAFDWNKEFPQIFTKKKKKTWHITTATHNSRYSQRMFDNPVNPGEAVWLSEQDEIIIAEIIADIVNKDKLSILEYSICGDHMHILLVCDENELPKIVGKIKAMTARACNIATGRTIPATTTTRGHVPLSGSDSETMVVDAEAGSDSSTNTKNEKKKKYNSLWTQKFGKRKITGDNDLQNVINYIRTNRQKHELPENKKLEKIIGEMTCSVDHAFRTEYTGGFDVVIGNPPYGAKIAKNELTFMLSKQGNDGLSKVLSDTYIAFYIESLRKLLKNSGLLGFITPNTWRLVQSGNKFRDFLSKGDFDFLEIIQHQEKVFSDATVDCDTVIIKKQKSNNHILRIAINNYYDSIYSHSISQNILAEQDFFNLFLTEKIYTLKQKIEEKSIFVKDCLQIKNGVKPYEKGKGKPPQTATTMKEKPFTSEIKIDESFSPLIGGSSFHRYKLLWNNDYWIKYGEWLAAPRDKEIFSAPEKLIFRQTGDSIIGTFVGNKFVMRNNTHIILPEDNDININLKYVLTVLNSRLSNFIYWTINPEKGEALAEVKAFHLGLLCFPKINTEDQQPFIEKADLLLSLNQELQEKKTKFLNRVKDNLATTVATRGHVPLANVPIIISKKLETFYNYDFKTLITELRKQKVTLSLSRQDEWEEYFTSYKDEINQLQDEIHTTDKEIDQMVYKLYGLTEEEIGIVEGEN